MALTYREFLNLAPHQLTSGVLDIHTSPPLASEGERLLTDTHEALIKAIGEQVGGVDPDTFVPSVDILTAISPDEYLGRRLRAVRHNEVGWQAFTDLRAWRTAHFERLVSTGTPPTTLGPKTCERIAEELFAHLTIELTDNATIYLARKGQDPHYS